MSFRSHSVSRHPSARARRGVASLLVLTLLLVEFLDEVLDGVRGAAWPLVRDDLRLTYTQIGLLISIPPLVGNLVEPVFSILADVWRRRVFVRVGGVLFAASALLVASSRNFFALLAAYVVFNPAAGAFVGLSQAALMDAEPARREQNMARWTLFGSLGNFVGPLLVGAAVAFGFGWRWLYAGLAAFSVLVLALVWRLPFPTPAASEGVREGLGFAAGVREAVRALRRREVLRWLVLLRFGEFTSDVLRGFLALYFVDVAGTSEATAALAVVVWTCAVLPGDVLLIPLLERVRGLSYLRVSTACVLVLFPAFLLADGLLTKFVLVGLLGLANAGWYAILKARLYSELPERSGTAMTLGNLFGLVGDFLPLALGAFAQRFGLEAMMWLLLFGPVMLLAGLLTAPSAPSEAGERRG
ncbi:MAG TPA: MFS transporter [Pyrinomonadaceae bacterium]|nr:MFS transporter [Pyrinomonadaceae bacterium]